MTILLGIGADCLAALLAQAAQHGIMISGPVLGELLGPPPSAQKNAS